jgi:hypothetical protein
VRPRGVQRILVVARPGVVGLGLQGPIHHQPIGEEALFRSAVVTLGATIRKCREAGRPDAAEELERLRLEVVRVIARLGRA